MKVAVLGAGAYGLALGQVLTENSYDVEYYDPILGGPSFEKAIDGAEVILLVVPSAALADTLPRLPKTIPIIVATKGILDEKVFNEFSDVMIISGPGFADDIQNHKPTLLTASDKRVGEMFGTDYLNFDYTDDLRGILLCGALKNIYAILAGLLNLQPDTKEHEKFLSEVADEMKAILDANGAHGDTVELACGKGDLRITCGKPSRNYDFGQKVRLDPKHHPTQTVEGLTALRKIINGEIKVPESARYLRDLMRRSEKWS